MANYSSFVQSMNIIPHMNITTQGAISYKGNPNIVLLLNGVATTYEELQSISKEDISKVDIYENPPAQYALNGASCVLNVITKKDITGEMLHYTHWIHFIPLMAEILYPHFTITKIQDSVLSTTTI